MISDSRGCPTLIGVPFDGQSSYLRGAAEAPAKIRAAMNCDASNRWTESGIDLGVADAFEDAGDLVLPSNPEFEISGGDSRLPQNRREAVHSDFPGCPVFDEIVKGIDLLIDRGKRAVSLGGDHSITYPIVKAFAKRYTDLTIFHFDAHPDLYDDFEGNRLSHACPFARIMEAGLAKRLVQVGIRTLNGHQREQARRFGVEVVEMRSLPAYEKLKSAGPVYVTFDMDVLDPAFAPGISHREPGGMTVREAIAHLHAIRGEIVGADLVEYNPVQDLAGMTSTVAAKILKELLGKMILGT
jgi:arginase